MCIYGDSLPPYLSDTSFWLCTFSIHELDDLTQGLCTVFWKQSFVEIYKIVIFLQQSKVDEHTAMLDEYDQKQRLMLYWWQLLENLVKNWVGLPFLFANTEIWLMNYFAFASAEAKIWKCN